MSESKESQQPKHLHAGHRKRKREQIIKGGLENLPEHEPLEFLLFYAIPRGDTNFIAHNLINRFGSLVNVLNADFEELKKVDGVGDSAAAVICFFRLLAKLYLKKQVLEPSEQFNGSNRLKELYIGVFAGVKTEEVHCMYLTDDLRLISEEKVCSGRIGTVEIPIRSITRSIMGHNCGRLVIAHNHPAGSCIPSKADIDTTKSLISLYSKMDVELVDHIIVGRDGVTSMRELGYM